MQERIKADLEKLHEEIQWLGSVDADTRALMDSLVQDINERLEAEEHEQAELKSRLEEAVTHFEVEHPRVAALVNNIITTLGNMGI